MKSLGWLIGMAAVSLALGSIVFWDDLAALGKAIPLITLCLGFALVQVSVVLTAEDEAESKEASAVDLST